MMFEETLCLQESIVTKESTDCTPLPDSITPWGLMHLLLPCLFSRLLRQSRFTGEHKQLPGRRKSNHLTKMTEILEN